MRDLRMPSCLKGYDTLFPDTERLLACRSRQPATDGIVSIWQVWRGWPPEAARSGLAARRVRSHRALLPGRAGCTGRAPAASAPPPGWSSG